MQVMALSKRLVRRCCVSIGELSSGYATDVNKNMNNTFKMRAWQIHSYGDINELQYAESARIPHINSPDDILVEVESASVNPIDIAMTRGYGSVLLGAMRQFDSCELRQVEEFPLTLGRDFVGKIVQKGHAVGNDVNIGDDVWGVVPPHKQGAHADKVLVKRAWICKKPKNLTAVEAGSIPYAAMTAWSALKYSGDLFMVPASGKRTLVLGASGGVGTLATQLLKAWGATVVATCSEDAIPLVESLGADAVVDYKGPNASKRIRELGKYDIIFDTAGQGPDNGPNYSDCLKEWNLSKYVTITSPLMRNFDSYGLIGGLAKNALDIFIPNARMTASSFSSTVRWAFFYPSQDGLNEITTLVENGMIVPAVYKVYPFSELPAAYERVKSGHLRGKVIIQVKDSTITKEEDGGK